MKYLIFANADADQPMVGPVPEAEAEYFNEARVTLKEIGEEGFRSTFAPLFISAAKISYILDGDSFFALFEWNPGLIILSVKGRKFKWTALRSPVPDFGGREPLPEDKADDFDEDEPNPQYDLIFGPWDAQFDEEYREDGEFVEASKEDCAPYQAAMTTLEPMFVDAEANQNTWDRIEALAGEGIRL